jgi:5-methylcytosine-specific restriction enzyme subunit McrC
MSSTVQPPPTFTTEYEIPIRNLWHMLLYAWNELPDVKVTTLAEIDHAPTLDSLLALMLIKLLRQRLRVGLGRGYTQAHGAIKAIRGKVNFSESLKRRAFEQGQAWCEYQPYHQNTLKNQIIRSTVLHLIRAGNFGANKNEARELRHHLQTLFHALEGVDLLDLTPALTRRQVLERDDQDYRLMLAICDLVVQRHLPTNANGEKLQPSLDVEALTLHSIYERFVANFYRLNLKGWAVSAQKHLHWHEAFSNDLLPVMRPDLVLENIDSGKILVIDTKFTAHSLIQTPWGKQEFDSSHLYQLYAYLKTQEYLSEQHRRAEGILLYPSTTSKNISQRIQLQDMSIRVESVDLSAPWQDIEARLMMLVS